jgi:hypothetical protein
VHCASRRLFIGIRTRLPKLSSFPEFSTGVVDEGLHQGICILLSILARGELMTSEMIRKSYQAVRCLFCSEPIRLSTRLSELCVFESDETPAERQRKSQVFILRCEACSKENRYLKSEIEAFAGEPPTTSDANHFGPRSYRSSLRKAAAQ